jgi:mRNA interferase HigB
VNIISRPTIIYYANKYPLAATSLYVWYKDFVKLEFENFNELKNVYSSASIVANSRVIFNIKGNSFRLIVSVNFKKQAAYVIWFGTHAEYDRIDAATIPYITIN